MANALPLLILGGAAILLATRKKSEPAISGDVISVEGGIPWNYTAEEENGQWKAWVSSPRGGPQELEGSYQSEEQALSIATDYILKAGGFPVAEWSGTITQAPPDLKPGEVHHVYIGKVYYLSVNHPVRSATVDYSGSFPLAAITTNYNSQGDNRIAIFVRSAPSSGEQPVKITYYANDTASGKPVAEFDFIVSANPWWEY